MRCQQGRATLTQRLSFVRTLFPYSAYDVSFEKYVHSPAGDPHPHHRPILILVLSLSLLSLSLRLDSSWTS